MNSSSLPNTPFTTRALRALRFLLMLPVPTKNRLSLSPGTPTRSLVQSTAPPRGDQHRSTRGML